MSDDTTTPPPVDPAAPPADPPKPATGDGDEPLGPPGLKALESMKERERAARAELRERDAAMERMREDLAKAQGREAEYAALKAEQERHAELIAARNRGLLEARVESAAKGVLQDPDLALKLIDLSVIDVADDGTVDRAAIEAAVSDLVKNRPYLGVQGPGVFRGGADSGPRKADAKSLDQQIADARANGDWRSAIRLENQKLPLGG